MQKLKADEVIEKFGGIRPLASRLGLSASTVQGWKKRGIIPESRIETVLRAANEDGIRLDGQNSASPTEPHIEMPDVDHSNTAQEEDKDDKKVHDISANPSPTPISESAAEFERRKREADRRARDRRLSNDPNYKGRERRITDRRSGLDRRRVAKIRQREIRQTKRNFIERTLLTFAFLFIAIALAAGFILAPEYLEIQKKAARVDQLENQVQALDTRLQSLDERHGSLRGRLNNRIAEIEEKTTQIAGAAGTVGSEIGGMMNAQRLQERLEALENSFAGMSLQISDVDSMLRNLDTMRQSPEGQQAMNIAMEELKKVVSNLQGDVGELNTAVDQARHDNRELATVLQDVSKQDVGAAAMLLALGQFRDAVGRNQEPFARDIAIMRNLVGDDPEMVAALDNLTPYAEQGVLSQDRLSSEFKGLAGDIIMAKMSGEDLSIQDKAKSRLDNLVTVRKQGYVEGQETEAVVARAQYLLDQGDVKGAMSELQTLEGPAAEAATPWMRKAAGRIVADDMAQQLSNAFLTKLTQGQTGSVSGLENLLKSGFGGSGLPSSLKGQKKPDFLP